VPQPTGFKATIAEYKEVASLFLRLGTLGFGGPAAHVSLMQRETVLKRGWLSREDFLDLLGAVNLMPGPSSSQMAIFLGFRRAGWVGLLLAGLCFVLPAALITLAIAWAYQRYGSLPRAQGLLAGVRPVIVVVILDAIWRLGKTAFRSPWLAALGLLALAALFAQSNPLLVMVTSGLIAMAAWAFKIRASSSSSSLSIAPVALWPIFWVFLKLGAIVFGSGYVLLAFLRADLVHNLHWLDERQLLDAVAAGQITPGPVFTTATFIGYLLAGVPGSIVATAAVFLPSFVLVAASGPILRKLRDSAAMAAFLDGVNAGAIALMAAVCYELGRSAMTDWFGYTLAAVAALLVLWKGVNPLGPILAGAALGLVRGG
jgi:chromate transporter